MGTALEAGSETTAATLYAFVQAMILFPDVQEKARSHVEAVCGDRLPEMADYDNLGYIRAVMKETIRWLPTAVLGAVVT
jgi:cytochrome P450